MKNSHIISNCFFYNRIYYNVIICQLTLVITIIYCIKSTIKKIKPLTKFSNDDHAQKTQSLISVIVNHILSYEYIIKQI